MTVIANLTAGMLIAGALAGARPAAAAQPSQSAPTGALRPGETTPVDTMSKVEKRHRLAHCASQWQKMKRTGQDVGLIWRDFSASCMTDAATIGAASRPGKP